MSSVFPDRFALKNLIGPRAAQYTRPEDGFQQLVGDGLTSAFGHFAFVYPTRGQDGSIDAFIDKGCTLDEPFTGVELPAIIECKHHDDTLPRINENILEGWKRVESKLARQAQKGWSDRFSPWKGAAGYVYCVSVAIPDQDARERLRQRIEAFFDQLPAQQRPPVRTVRVLGWGELRHWLSARPQVCDSWLGTSLPAIIDHHTYLGRLHGFKKLLLTSGLSFISPERGAPWHPQNLLEQLSSDSVHGGALLVAPGGVGKTRTSLEVATLALSAGWRVLHVLPGEPAVTADDIASAVVPFSGRTLLVFDYLDQMQDLDLETIRTRLLPEVRSRGNSIALLANSRPGWMRTQNRERDQLFVPITLRLTRLHSECIVEEIITKTASFACKHIGRSEVARLCGHRPIIALLVTRELERRAVAGTLSELKLNAFRTGDLARWLRERLAEPPLNLVRKGELLDRPEVPIVALAAALACAPGKKETLVQVANQTFRALSWDRPEESGQLIERLLELGWLEEDGSWIVAAHDVVADEVFDWAIRDVTNVRVRELSAILESAIHVPHAMGRFASAFRRMFSGIDDGSTHSIQSSAATWLRQNAPRVGLSLVQGDPNLTGYALGSVIFGPPWNEIVAELWQHLLAPWIAAYGTNDEARHILTTGLDNSRIRNHPEFLDAALLWVRKRNGARHASCVLMPLLAQNSAGLFEARVIAEAIKWLEHRRLHYEAADVIEKLLLRKSLGSAAETVQDLALSWLTINSGYWEAGRILGAALHRSDLGSREDTFIRIGAAWLTKNMNERAAAYVLEPFLEHERFSRQMSFTLHATWSWLGKFALREEAAFVLNPLIGGSRLGSTSKRAISITAPWLNIYKSYLVAGFVLPNTLKCPDLGEHTKQILDDAITWLDRFSTTDDARFVIPAILGRSDVSSHLDRVMEFVTKWLNVHRVECEAAFVLEAVLAVENLNSYGSKMIEEADKWLQVHRRSPTASFVLTPLLERRDMGGIVERILQHASAWVDSNQKNPDADFVLNRLLRRSELSNEDWCSNARSLLQIAVLKRYDPIGLDYKVTTLCRRVELLETDERISVADLAVDWLSADSAKACQNTRVRGGIEKLAQLSPDTHPLKSICMSLWGSLPRVAAPEERFDAFVIRLNGEVKRGRRLEAEAIEDACRRIHTQAQRAPASAAWALPPLLVLGARAGAPMLNKARSVVTGILNDKRLTYSQYRGLTTACLRLAEGEPIPVRSDIQTLLAELNVASPRRRLR